MRNGSYVVDRSTLARFMKDGAMNAQEGISLIGITDDSVARLLPPPLTLLNPEAPLFYVYIVNIREPTFAPWYMEGGIGLMAKYGDTAGLYFLNLQLSGPGALMGAFSGRETSGLPKKLCERIVVERIDDYAHCFIERKGIRLIDVELEVGHYNAPQTSVPQESCRNGERYVEEGICFLHRYSIDPSRGFADLGLYLYDSRTGFDDWEPAAATITMQPSIDDPCAEVPVKSVLSSGWMKSDNWIEKLTKVYDYPDDDVDETMRYLFTGRWDHSVVSSAHQRYE